MAQDYPDTLRKVRAQPLLAVSRCVRDPEIKAAEAARLRKVDIPVVLQLGHPDTLAFTLPEQEIIVSHACSCQLFENVSPQNESHAISSMIGVKPFLQEKDRISISEAELSGGCLAIEAYQPKFQALVCQQSAA
jgi:hypothetical protein